MSTSRDNILPKFSRLRKGDFFVVMNISGVTLYRVANERNRFEIWNVVEEIPSNSINLKCDEQKTGKSFKCELDAWVASDDVLSNVDVNMITPLHQDLIVFSSSSKNDTMNIKCCTVKTDIWELFIQQNYHQLDENIIEVIRSTRDFEILVKNEDDQVSMSNDQKICEKKYDSPAKRNRSSKTRLNQDSNKTPININSSEKKKQQIASSSSSDGFQKKYSPDEIDNVALSDTARLKLAISQSLKQFQQEQDELQRIEAAKHTKVLKSSIGSRRSIREIDEDIEQVTKYDKNDDTISADTFVEYDKFSASDVASVESFESITCNKFQDIEMTDSTRNGSIFNCKTASSNDTVKDSISQGHPLSLLNAVKPLTKTNVDNGDNLLEYSFKSPKYCRYEGVYIYKNRYKAYFEDS